MIVKGYCKDCKYLAVLWDWEDGKKIERNCCTLFSRDKKRPTVMALNGDLYGSGSTCECFEEKMK